MIAVTGAFGLALAGLILEGNAEIPTWTGTLVGAIVAFYFGERAAVVASRNGLTNGDAPTAKERAAATVESDKQ